MLVISGDDDALNLWIIMEASIPNPHTTITNTIAKKPATLFVIVV